MARARKRRVTAQDMRLQNASRRGTRELYREKFSTGERERKIFELTRRQEDLRRLIWGFRKANGWKDNRTRYSVPEGYWGRTLNSYLKIGVTGRDLKIINFLSSPEAIHAIRQRGRMRQAASVLGKRELKRLQKEMNAALRWVFAKSHT
ncbi:MAG: hypothetical protein JW744_02425 [Candidatus Diapherotrites archaeon]|uniref:Uncharacterized protein n=1 Tax=Candidatus Iainarchaeum sp. TaxID=3101447 RepID=A0A938YN97_9ARCH|nr:hypothetical protein [Candidatus Diapherotrites archaeon]